jgi:transcriptional regulator with XRE-family HTH domain
MTINDIFLPSQSIFDRVDGINRVHHALLMIDAHQCRAARGLLDWSQADLAEKAGVGIVTVRQFEAGGHDPRRATLDVIRRAFESAGVEFIDENGGGPGVRLRKRTQKIG